MGLESIRTSYNKFQRARWRTCHVCQDSRHIQVEVDFYSGATSPVIGEILTGRQSNDSGTILEIKLSSGSWAIGDAAGTMVLESPSGIDDDGNWGQKDEVATTPLSGQLVLANVGFKKDNAMLYPEADMINDDGVWYCKWHYEWRFNPRHRDENIMELDDEGLEQI